MDFIGADYQVKQIKKHQKFLLKLLHIRIGNYYPLRKYLGIDFKGKIDEITNLSIAYNTKHFPKNGKWYEQVTRTYQQPDLGYKLNFLLDKIPQLALLPALLQPAYGCLALAFFFLTTTTYQPSTKDTYLEEYNPNSNYGTATSIYIWDYSNNHINSAIHFDTTDIPAGAVFSQGDVMLYAHSVNGTTPVDSTLNRLTQLGWVETEATWNVYSTGNNWATAGGDSTATNNVSLGISATGWQTWSGVSLIQDCYDNQSKNVHLLLRYVDTANDKNVYFYSREYATDTSLRPKLTVTYTVPSGNFFHFF